jgi:hypothetical protein
MPNAVPFARHGAVILVALASLAALVAPMEQALADTNTSIPVTAVNPVTSPAPTTVGNPATGSHAD